MVLAIYSNIGLGSCPLELSLGASGTEGLRRESLRLFVPAKSSWQELPVQIDPTDGQGGLTFADINYMKNPVEPYDRMRVQLPQSQQQKLPPTPPCKSSWGREVEAGSARAWLFSCESSRLFESPIQYDPTSGLITSKYYKYYFNPENHILFEDILLKKDGGWVSVARDSHVNFYVNIKNFFNLTFGPSDISSKLEHFRFGPLGLVGKVSFYVNILFFKIKLSLVTDVHFYEKQVNVPMIMYAPRDLAKNLNPGSGVYYSWKSELPFSRTKIPAVSREKRDPNDPSLCSWGMCNFGISALSLFNMQLKVPGDLVHKNFYPQWAEATKENHKIFPAILAIKEEKKEGSTPNTQGLYFEVSGLPQGEHKWDFWMSMDAEGEETCPTKGQWGKLWK